MNYSEIVAAGRPAAILFTSATCGPCARLKPRMMAMAMDKGFELHILDIAGEMPAVRGLGIRGVPALVTVGPGMSQLQFQGDRTDAQILEVLERAGVLA